jgi:hypothetical protein
MCSIATIDFRNGCDAAKNLLPRGASRLRREENCLDIVELVQIEEEAIVAEALTAVTWLEHYERDGEDTARERLRALCQLVGQAIRTQNLEELLTHAERIARERHAAGYDRAEVVSAFSAVEEAIWHRALVALPAQERTWGLGLVGTALSHAKEALARAFAEVGAGARPSFVDMSPLFRGAGAAGRDRFSEDLVHPV